MAEMIAVVGESGSGKSTSIRNLNPKETFIISTTGKRPGIKGAIKKYPTFAIGKPFNKLYIHLQKIKMDILEILLQLQM